jgi:hypothetical protein
LLDHRVQTQCRAQLGLSTGTLPDSPDREGRVHQRYLDIWNALLTNPPVTHRVAFGKAFGREIASLSRGSGCGATGTGTTSRLGLRTHSEAAESDSGWRKLQVLAGSLRALLESLPPTSACSRATPETIESTCLARKHGAAASGNPVSKRDSDFKPDSESESNPDSSNDSDKLDSESSLGAKKRARLRVGAQAEPQLASHRPSNLVGAD